MPPYYYPRKNGMAYWEPRGNVPKGFEARPLGPHGPEAQGIAQRLYAEMVATRRGEIILARETPRWPAGSVGAAWDRYRAPSPYAGLPTEWDRKAPRTQEEWQRVWNRLEPFFADINPATITPEDVSMWRAIVERDVSLREAHRCIKIWRALWQVMAGYKMVSADQDPSRMIRNSAAAPRGERWAEWEIARIAKEAWRRGYKGLAAVLAVTWDGMMAPVDARTFTLRQRVTRKTGQAISIIRGKTGETALAPLTLRSRRVLDAYLAEQKITALDQPVFRTRRGAIYTKNSLAEDFRDIRAVVFPGDTRTIMDIRRSGALEASAGAADPKAMADAMGNSIDKNKALQRAYTPSQMATVMTIPTARRAGRANIRRGEE